MLRSELTWWDLIFFVIIVLLIFVAVISYKWGYGIGFAEGRHVERQTHVKKKEVRKKPKDNPTVQIVGRRRGNGAY